MTRQDIKIICSECKEEKYQYGTKTGQCTQCYARLGRKRRKAEKWENVDTVGIFYPKKRGR